MNERLGYITAPKEWNMIQFVDTEMQAYNFLNL